MDIRGNLRSGAEQARLMVKLSVVGVVVSGILALAVLVLGVSLRRFSGSDIFPLTVIPFSLAFFFSVASLIYGIMNRGAALEEEEKLLLEKRKESHSAFNVGEDVRFTAGRSFDNYRKYGPYALSVLAALFVLGSLWLFRASWAGRLDKAVVSANPLVAALVAAVLLAIAIFSGAFYVGQSRQAAFRWLRPIGSWLLGGVGVLLLSVLSLVFAVYKVLPGFDVAFAGVVWWIGVVLGAELLFNFAVEFYRPRTLEEPRPIFESRLLAFFTEPGGVMRNIAESLDYQFGFKVSGTWLYGFVERALFPLLIFWLLLLWAFTGINEVGPGEIGFHERFGAVDRTPLKPGIYCTLPWPFAKVSRFACDRIQTITIGEGEGKEKHEEATPVVLWTKQHMENEASFVVAVDPKFESMTVDAGTSNAVPISLLGLTMPVQYKVRNDAASQYAYAYGKSDPRQMLTRIGQEVTTRYLASSSIFRVMTSGRSEAEREIHRRIQTLADDAGLGLEIVAVNLLDVHPPVEKVAPAFQEVIGAMETMHSIELQAEAYRIQTEAAAQAQADELISAAKSHRFRVTRVAKAEQDRFRSQLVSFQAFPELFMLNMYFQMLENGSADNRKFVVSAGLKSEIYELNFEEKARFDLIDADMNTLVNKQ